MNHLLLKKAGMRRLVLMGLMMLSNRLPWGQKFPHQNRPEKNEVTVGLTVTDEKLGKGVVSRITERGVYVTYEATGEHVMYPQGLPVKLKKSAFPERKKEKKTQ